MLYVRMIEPIYFILKLLQQDGKSLKFQQSVLRLEKAHNIFGILKLTSVASAFDKNNVVILAIEFTSPREPFIVVMLEFMFAFEVNRLFNTADTRINDEFNIFSKADAFV